MVKLRIKNIRGEIKIKKNWWDLLIDFCQIGMLILTILIYFEGIPRIEESIKNISSVNIQQPINIQPTVDVYATLSRNKSTIKFDVPKDFIEAGSFETICYIGNNQGDAIYVVKELNFTSCRLKLNEREEFPCEIRNGEVYRILRN